MGTAELDKKQARISNSFGVEQCWHPTKSKYFLLRDKVFCFSWCKHKNIGLCRLAAAMKILCIVTSWEFSDLVNTS